MFDVVFSNVYMCVSKDEKRMERMKRRLDELELVQNNVKLMNELLSHYKSDSGEEEKLLLKVKYNYSLKTFALIFIYLL